MAPEEDILLETERFSVVQIAQQLDDGTSRSRAVVRHPGSVVIIPLVDENHVCLIRNRRASVNRTLIELPAGTLEKGEDPHDCAIRELSEETGYHAAKMAHFAEFFPAPGILDENMHMFVASGLTPGKPHREPHEEIENLVVSCDEISSLLDSREIVDGKTLIGLLLWLRDRKNVN